MYVCIPDEFLRATSETNSEVTRNLCGRRMYGDIVKHFVIYCAYMACQRRHMWYAIDDKLPIHICAGLLVRNLGW